MPHRLRYWIRYVAARAEGKPIETQQHDEALKPVWRRDRVIVPVPEIRCAQFVILSVAVAGRSIPNACVPVLSTLIICWMNWI